MKLPIITCLLLAGCSSANQVTTSVVSTWSSSSTNKTAKIKVVTNYYKGNDGLHANSIYTLTHLGYEIASSGNPIIIKCWIIYNGISAKYSMICHDLDIVISGVYGKSSLGGHFWETVVKGTGNFGTPWFKKMKVFAEATNGGTIYFSDK